MVYIDEWLTLAGAGLEAQGNGGLGWSCNE